MVKIGEMEDKERVLITGVSGLSGSHMVEELKEDYEIVGVHRSKRPFSNLRMMNLQDQITEELIDITEFETVRDLISYYEPDHIVHLAAQAIAGRGYENPVLTYRTNLMGTINLLEGVRLSHVNPSITTMSTDKVFGNTSKAAIDDKYLPTGPYGTSKICADAAARSFKEFYDMDIRIVRSVNIYGYESYNRRIVSNTITQCLKGKNPVLFDNIKGEREYIYVKDFTSAISRIIQNDPGRYHITTDNIFSQKEVVKTILSFFPDLEPEHREKEDSDLETSHISLEKTNFDWEPEYSFKEGLKETIEHYREYGSKELSD